MQDSSIPEHQPVPLAAFSDNYIWLLRVGKKALVVDPGDANAVKSALERAGLTLTTILITHHHPDHTGGLAELCNHYKNVEVYGPAATNHPAINNIVADGSRISLPAFNLSLEVIATPGHTLDHHCFFAQHNNKPGWLFCGDTLFSAGCGRLFEGSPAQMRSSLQKLASLPATTQVFCAHEYTLANLEFAAAADPDNADLKAYQRQALEKRHRGEPTIPSDIATERQINPFLRSDTAGIRNTLHKLGAQNEPQGRDSPPLATADSRFAALRLWKDDF